MSLSPFVYVGLTIVPSVSATAESVDSQRITEPESPIAGKSRSFIISVSMVLLFSIRASSSQVIVSPTASLSVGSSAVTVNKNIF